MAVSLDGLFGVVDRLMQSRESVNIAKNLIADSQLQLIPPQAPVVAPGATMRPDELMAADEQPNYDLKPASQDQPTLAGLKPPDTAAARLLVAAGAAQALAASLPFPTTTAGRANSTATAQDRRSAAADATDAAEDDTAVADPSAGLPATAGDRVLLARSVAARAALAEALDMMLAITQEAVDSADEAEAVERSTTARTIQAREAESRATGASGTAATAQPGGAAAARGADGGRTATGEAAARRLDAGRGEAGRLDAGRTRTDATAGADETSAAGAPDGKSAPTRIGLPDPATLTAWATEGGGRTGIIESFILNAAMIPGWPRPRPLVGAEPKDVQAKPQPEEAGGPKDLDGVGEAELAAYLAILGLPEAMMARIRAMLADDERRRGFILTLMRLLKAVKLILAALKDELETMRREALEEKQAPMPEAGEDTSAAGRLHLRLK